MGPAVPVCLRAKGRTHPKECLPRGTALPGLATGQSPSSFQGVTGPWERPVRVLRSLLWAEVRHFWQILCCPEGSKHVNTTGSSLLDLGEGPGLPVPPAEGMFLSAWTRWMSGSEGGAGLGGRPLCRVVGCHAGSLRVLMPGPSQVAGP